MHKNPVNMYVLVWCNACMLLRHTTKLSGMILASGTVFHENIMHMAENTHRKRTWLEEIKEGKGKSSGHLFDPMAYFLETTFNVHIPRNVTFVSRLEMSSTNNLKGTTDFPPCGRREMGRHDTLSFAGASSSL